MTTRSKRSLIIIYVVLALCLIGGLIRGVPRSSDYEIFLLSGVRLRAGEALYQAADGIFPFKYHPVIALFWGVWSWIPKVAGKILFDLAQLAMIAWTLRYWIARILGRENLAWLLAVTMLVSIKMIWRELEFSQTNGLLYYGATMAIILRERTSARDHLFAGMIVAALTLVKLNYALLFVLGIIGGLSGLLPFCAGAALTAVIATAMTFGWFGVTDGLAVHRSWLDLLFGVSKTQYTDQENQGVLHFFSKYFPLHAQHIWLAVTGAFSAVGIFALRRRPIEYVYAFWLFGVNFLSPLAWWNQYVLALPMLLLVWRDRKSRVHLALLAAPVATWTIFQYETFGRELYTAAVKGLVPFYGMVLLLIAFADLARYTKGESKVSEEAG